VATRDFLGGGVGGGKWVGEWLADSKRLWDKLG
jgi:hypothetical protein